MNTEYERLWLHFKYCAFIALAAVVAVANERWSSRPDFTTYLGNAATMTSLLLGVIAIFYAFISNDSMSRSLGSINTVALDVQEAREKMNEFVHLTKDAVEANSENAQLVRSASSQISTSLVALEETLRGIATQNQTLGGLVASLPTRMEQIETKVGDVAKALGEKPTQTQTPATTSEISPAVIEKFLARSALSQNLLAYACVLAAQTERPLSIERFCDAVKFKSPFAYNSFLTCMYAVQLCGRRAVPGEEKTYKISSVHPALATRAKAYFVDYVEKEYADKPHDKQSWLDKLKNVEAMFADAAAPNA